MADSCCVEYYGHHWFCSLWSRPSLYPVLHSASNEAVLVPATRGHSDHWKRGKMRKLINWSEPRYSLISCSRFQTNTPDNFNSCCMQMSNMKENCILGNEENLGIGRERGILWVIRILGGTTGYYDLGYYTVGNTPRPDQMWGIIVGDCYSWLIIFWQDLGQLMQNTNKTIWKWQWQYWYRYQIIQFNETWLPTEKSLILLIFGTDFAIFT